jgi:hypothetical protein
MKIGLCLNTWKRTVKFLRSPSKIIKIQMNARFLTYLAIILQNETSIVNVSVDWTCFFTNFFSK